jgi:hypothetical protein
MNYKLFVVFDCLRCHNESGLSCEELSGAIVKLALVRFAVKRETVVFIGVLLSNIFPSAWLIYNN